MKLASKLVSIACTVLAWFGAPAARAESPGVVLIGGPAADQYRNVVGPAVEAAVRAAGWSLPPAPLAKPQQDGLLACLDAKPAASCVKAPLQVARLFIVKIERDQASDGAPVVILTGKGIVITPSALAVQQRHCEKCADDRLAAAATELAKRILQDLSQRDGRTVVELVSTPPGAAVTLDGVRVGVTNSTFPTYPDEHMAIFEKSGYFTEQRKFTVKEGQTASIYVTMRPLEIKPPSRSTASTLAPYGLLGLGGGLFTTGAVWIFYYGAKNCTDDGYSYKRAVPLGIGAAVVGVGAAGIGTYVLWKRSRRSTPTFEVRPDGAVVGWAGTLR